MRACLFGVAAAVWLSGFGGKAVAEEFSMRCGSGPDPQLYLTFDDQKKQAIAYGLLNGNPIPNSLSTGTIKAMSAEELQFDLFAFSNPNAKLGDYTLNRKDGWLESSRSNYQEKQKCHPTPLRTIMDLWEVFPHDP